MRQQAVKVRDARRADGPGTAVSVQEELLNGCGFVLLRQLTAVTDWMDEGHVAEHYYKECVQLAQRCLPGAMVLELDDHDLRKEETAGWEGETPAPFAHSDFAENVAERIVEVLPEAKRTFQGESLLVLNCLKYTMPHIPILPRAGRSSAGDAEHVAKCCAYGGRAPSISTV